MKIKAEYQVTSYQDRTIYECCIINNPNNELKNIKIQGQHVAGKNRLDVAAVKFDGCQLTKIPKNLTKIFPNLKFLIIWNSKLQKLTKQDLAEYKELEVIDIRYSLLSSLSGDIFEGFKDIKIIYFVGEELQSIEPNIFDGLLSLEMAWLAFIGNLEIYKKGSQSYKEFRQDLSVRFYSSGAGHVESYVKKLEQKVKKFKKIKEDLSGKVYRLEAIQEDLINKNDELKEEKAEMSSTSDFYISFYKDELRSLCRKLNKYEEGMLSDLKEFIQDKATKDFKIIIGSHEFPVHKILLAIRSPVLAEILKSNPAIKSLKLVDISVHTFEIILKFLYTDELQIDNSTNYLHVLDAAGKLKMKNLKKIAGIYVSCQLNLKNALETYKLGIKYDDEELIEKAFDMIKEKYPKIKFQDEWMNNAEKVKEVIKAFE